MNKKKLYIISDLHITVSPPESRLETEAEWIDVQKEILQQVTNIVKDDLLIITGDIIDTGLPYKSQIIVNMLVDYLPEHTVFISGNHPLKMFSRQLDLALEKGTLGNLVRTRLQYLPEGTTFEYGDYVLHPFSFKHERTLEHADVDRDKTNIALGHFLSYPKEVPFFVKEHAVTHESIIEEFPEYDFFLIGDNHKPDLTQGKYLSPGSLTRRTVKQVKYKPCVWCLESNEFTSIPLKVKPASECLTRVHIDKKEAREGRMEDWVDKTENTNVDEYNFEDGCGVYCKENELRPNTEDRLVGIIERCK